MLLEILGLFHIGKIYLSKLLTQTHCLYGTIGGMLKISPNHFFSSHHHVRFDTMAELKQTSAGQRKKYVYQDGVYRSNPRPSPHWNQGIAAGVLGVILIIIVMFVIGFFYFNPIKIEFASVYNNNTKPLPCPPPNKTIGFQYFAEDSLISTDYKYYFFEGRLSFLEAQAVCKKLPGGGDLITIQSSKHEKLFDESISRYLGKIFESDSDAIPSQRRQLWTGGYVDLELNGINRISWLDGRNVTEWHLNFCDIVEAKTILEVSLAEYKRNGAITDPLVYLVKDYNRDKKIGCWQLFSSMILQTHKIKFNFACQLSTARFPYQYTRRFLGKFREYYDPEKQSWENLANEYVAFAGQSSYYIAQDTCQRLAPGSQMLATRSLQRDNEVNKRVARYSVEIFGEDNGDAKRRTMIWTGGYFNLSSANPTRLRWRDDPYADTDIVVGLPSKRFLAGLFGSGEDSTPIEYENFCGTLEYYHKLVTDALNEERNAAKTTGCIKGRLFIVVKDFREGQPVQGCWHLYDFDYLSRYNYAFSLICQLPDPVKETIELKKESEDVYSYESDPKDP